ncbi:NEAT domain-containing protein [Clostridium sporogenes]|uniref:NEAT domain-containing protein n=1 Tax=Clostridium sporogenes TaxID=1509 RepID=UPI001C1073FD|nr:NEAT domain-containing protein [Clostridium sporogenes]MBU5298845.1 NEAT domain-containing protein [Clostridium sporogenes]
MKNKFIKLTLAGAISTGILISSSSVLATDINNNHGQVHSNKNIVLLAQKDGLEDGKYSVSFQTLKEKSAELSMAGQYVDSNGVLEVQGGNMYFTFKVLRNDWMKNIKVLVDDAPVQYEHASQDNEGKVSGIKFQIPNKKPNIKIRMNVVPMDNADVAFRMVLNDDIKKISGESPKESSKKSDDNNKSSKSSNAEKELPQTGFPISNGSLLLMGGLSTLLGAGLLKKRK